ncbi:MAG TPA: HAMP domain-containing sensor histidine kinase [Vicinamibacterales bacterium]|nr:HAMP domain-containing sensor histidine kinase [Vicinamibacterales bacterium]
MRDSRLLLVLVLALAMMAPSMAQAPQPEPSAEVPTVAAQQSVLFLAIDDFTRPYMRFIFEAFTDAVMTAATPPAIYFESLDASRFEEAEHLENLREWLRRKYRERHIDLILPIGEDALDFLAAAHGEPWPDAQVLYFESGSVRVDTRSTLPRAGGVLLEDPFAAQMEVVKKVLPEVRRVALVYGASAIELARWRGYPGKVREAGLEPVELVGISMEETHAALSRLPDTSAALVLAPIVDMKGNVVSPVHVCDSIAAAGTVPVLSFEVNNLGCGAVGGLLRDWSRVGRILGEEALARLASPSTEVVTVPVARFTTMAFDDRQLQRWNIPERRLPPGAVLQFREPNFWRDRRGLVIAVVSVTLLQTFLIAGLVFERRRRRQAEIDSRRNLTAIAHLDRRAAMGELATSLAHELNQPLNAILQNAGMAQMLLTSTTVPAELSEMPDIIGDIRKDDIRASEVIRRMRGLLQKHELEARPLDLNEVAEETVAIVRPDARSRGIELEASLADGLPRIRGDRVHLQQVLLNLLMNAMDAVSSMPPERRHVRVRTAQSNGDVRLDVVDTGIGIPPDRVRQIFEPFYTTKSEGSGMGMGLAIARGIVEAHDGRMGAENNATSGATVWFSVPLASNRTKVL